MEATGSSVRYRVNPSRNAKGAWTFDFTYERVFSEVEIATTDEEIRRENVLREMRNLQRDLEALYPAITAPEKAAVNGAS